ncbi:hypothetical protein ACFOHS_01965 [Jhaorihella thermophila]
MMVTLVGVFLLADVVTPVEFAGIFVLGLGIIAMSLGGRSCKGNRGGWCPMRWARRWRRRGIRWSMARGARISGDPATYVGWLLILSAVFYTPVVIGLKGSHILRADGRTWGMGLVAAAASYAAYAVVVWAMTQAPIALVTALRETSIPFCRADRLAGVRRPHGPDQGRCRRLDRIGGVILTRL